MDDAITKISFVLFRRSDLPYPNTFQFQQIVKFTLIRILTTDSIWNCFDNHFYLLFNIFFVLYRLFFVKFRSKMGVRGLMSFLEKQNHKKQVNVSDEICMWIK